MIVKARPKQSNNAWRLYHNDKMCVVCVGKTMAKFEEEKRLNKMFNAPHPMASGYFDVHNNGKREKKVSM